MMSKTGPYTYTVQVLGCKANQYDAQQLRCVAQAMGLTEVQGNQCADVIMVHTCAVTANALRKSLQAVRKLFTAHADATLIITGCGTAVPAFEAPVKVAACIPPGPGWLRQVADVLRTAFPDLQKVNVPVCADDFPIESFAQHARAFLKIQDGCDNACSYCIVPRLRGPSRDKKMKVILEEARALSRAGFRELVISGVSVGLYGQKGGPSLADVMQALVALPETERLRLSSLHPNELTPELLAVWKESPKMLPHVHLPLQAGSDAVLHRMNRGYTQQEFIDATVRVRQVLDKPAFTTDVIVGFPGESPEDFNETMHVARQVGFSRMHIFPYSPRPGTRAENDARAAGSIVKARCAQLSALADELAVSFYQQFQGQTIRMLVERCSRGMCRGYSDRYMPVTFKGSDHLQGEIVSVRVSKISSREITATYIPPNDS